jgi:hypothetical protein
MRSQGSSLRKRCMVSKVAPPQVSTAQKPDLVHQFGHRDHVLGAAAGGKQALVAVAQAQIHDLHRIFRLRPVTS